METKINIIIILVLFFILLFICFLFSLILFYILKFIRKKLNWNSKANKYLKLYLIISSILFSLYNSYTAVYPNDNFYFSEFEYVTNLKIPNSAEIKFKKSTYPDFHGDYSSKSIIELSENDFEQLLKKLENDKTLIETKSYDKQELKTFQRKIKGESDRFLFIKFLKNRKTIITNIDFT